MKLVEYKMSDRVYSLVEGQCNIENWVEVVMVVSLKK